MLERQQSSQEQAREERDEKESDTRHEHAATE